jgi:hypothetical protein
MGKNNPAGHVLRFASGRAGWVLGAGALAAAIAIGTPALGRVADPAPARVQVRGSEFNLTLSKTKVKPGRAIVQFLNSGEDPHDLRLQRLGPAGAEGPELGLGEVEPGEYANLDTRLRKRSSYVLWCSLLDHRELGMEATLRTRRHRR